MEFLTVIDDVKVLIPVLLAFKLKVLVDPETAPVKSDEVLMVAVGLLRAVPKMTSRVDDPPPLPPLQAAQLNVPEPSLERHPDEFAEGHALPPIDVM